MITVQGLSKAFHGRTVLQDISFTVPNGQVTGFLGPNGSGKTTTMRIIAGLTDADSGSALVDGKSVRSLPYAGADLGVILDQRALPPFLTVRTFLRVIAHQHGIGVARVDELLRFVGMEAVPDARLATLSLGMRQRVALAAALIGDPPNLMFDEPVNGLDPDGVRWVREITKQLARVGKAVLVSSHLMTEMAQTADRIVVLGRGRVLAENNLTQLLEAQSERYVRVSATDSAQLVAALSGFEYRVLDPQTFAVSGTDIATLSKHLIDAGVQLTHLSEEVGSLEDVFLALTDADLEYRGER